jgi:hypothetical protein
MDWHEMPKVTKALGNEYHRQDAFAVTSVSTEDSHGWLRFASWI